MNEIEDRRDPVDPGVWMGCGKDAQGDPHKHGKPQGDPRQNQGVREGGPHETADRLPAGEHRCPKLPCSMFHTNLAT